MGERAASTARSLVPWRALALAALACALLAPGLAQILRPAPTTTPAARRTVAAAIAGGGLWGLPVEARGPVSSALGAADPSYRIAHISGGALAASNRAEGLSLRFDTEGASVRSQTLTLSLRLTAMGRGAALTPLAAATPSAGANRVLYSRAGLSEWYANGPLGLEQGFTLTRRPGGVAGAPLTLAVASAAGGHPELAEGGRAVLMRAPRGGELSYGDVQVTDARGRPLHAWLGLAGNRVLLRVNDRGAAYPLRVDPLVQEGPKLEGGSEQIEEQGNAVSHGALGYSLSLSANGETALIGAPNLDAYTGAAWVFQRSGGVWTEQAKLTAPGEPEMGGLICSEETSEECAFGRSVALSGDGNTAVVGGPRESDNAGAAWVFTREGAGWSYRATLTGGSEESAGGHFGRGVAISADGATIAVGAPGDRNGRGGAWVFTGSGAAWSQEGARITGAAEETGEAFFGVNVALSGDGSRLIVGGPGDSSYSGAAWLFSWTGSGWSQLSPKLGGGAEEIGEGRFGSSVALSSDGSTALVGARSDNGWAGAAWVFAPAGAAWQAQSAKLTDGEGAGAGEAGQRQFGYSVALSADGSLALIGAPRDDASVGSAWLFARSAGAWTTAPEQLTSSGGPGSKAMRGRFGASVSLRADGEMGLVGAPSEDREAGAAWAFCDADTVCPAVTGIAPQAGPTVGGTTVTLSGRRLAGTSAVDFGATPAERFTVNSDSSVTAVAPPHQAGGVCVTVTTPEGASASGTACPVFEYLPTPTLTTVTPHEGTTAGGTLVTITGKNIGAAEAVSFGAVPAAGFTVTSPEQLIAVTPAEPEGEVPVTVATPGGTGGAPRAQWFLFQPGTSAGGGVLGFGAAGPGGACAASLLGRSLHVGIHSRAAVKLRWRGAGSCRGKIRINVKVKAGRHRLLTRTIGVSVFSLASGHSLTLLVKLNSRGRALMSRAHGHLHASLLIAPLPGVAGVAHTAAVRLDGYAKKPR